MDTFLLDRRVEYSRYFYTSFYKKREETEIMDERKERRFYFPAASRLNRRTEEIRPRYRMVSSKS